MASYIQGGGQVYYEIKSINTDATVFEMDPLTGELTMVQPARSDLVEGGQFSVVIRATDGGTPPLHSDIQVKICELLFSDKLKFWLYDIVCTQCVNICFM